MSLPNSSSDKIKVYPNEYVNNITVNRPNLRLLQNDIYLESLMTGISGISSSDITNLSASIDINTNSIDTLSAAKFVGVPGSVSATGNPREISIDTSGNLYIYSPLSGSLNWGKIALDYVW